MTRKPKPQTQNPSKVIQQRAPKKRKPAAAKTQPRIGTQLAAVEATIAELEAAGSVLPVHAATLGHARGLATAVDADPSNGALWREYRAALKDLELLRAADSDLARQQERLIKLLRGEASGDGDG